MNRATEENLKRFYVDGAITVEQARLVQYTARRLQEYIPKEMPWEDVLQYGFIGLIKARKQYEASTGKFNCFAGFYISGNIIDGIFQFRGMKRCRTAAKVSLKKMKMAENDVEKTEDCRQRKEETDENIFEKIEERLSLIKALNDLMPDERELIEAYYFNNRSWEEYAREKFVDVKWVYLMHRRILKKLRKWLKG